jgi:RNA polymerase sigma-70 factor (ECF subfamily)
LKTKHLGPDNVTRLLVEATAGDREALDRLMPLVYDELRRVASRRLARERGGQTLQTTALVNEAYLRLIDQREVRWENRAQFFALAARMMRFILVDYARRKKMAKRDAGLPVTCDVDSLGVEPSIERLLVLDQALERLEAHDARKSRVAEMRLFSGLSVEETASALSVSAVTVMRDWRLARAWLQRELRPA